MSRKTGNAIIFLLGFATLQLNGFQKAEAQNARITYSIPDSVEYWMKARESYYRELGTVPGYRVQLFFGSRVGAQAIRDEFEALFPEYKTYIIYDSPNFKLRAGDFRNKLDAYPLYKQAKLYFKTVFIVADQINHPKLD